MSALEGKAASGFAKLQTEEEEYLFYNLPADISDPLWVDIKGEYNLSSQELGALKNARCQAVAAAPQATINWGICDKSFIIKESFITVSMSGSGVGEGDRMLYMRPAAKALWAALENASKEQNSVILGGPPGCGKSSVAWAHANQEASDDNTILWIHFSREPSTTMCLMSSTLRSANVKSNQLDHFLDSFNGSRIIVDGYTTKLRDQHGNSFASWRINMKRPVFYVSSEQMNWGGEDLEDFDTPRLDGWILEDYQVACKNEEFFDRVRSKLQESSSTAGAAASSSSSATNLDSLLDDVKNDMILEKFFIAGHSARWMFYFSTAKALGDADNWLRRIGNKKDLISGMGGTDNLLAVNHLLSRFGDKNILVSEYVTRSLMWDLDVETLKILTTYSTELHNPAFDGIVFELDFMLRLRLQCETSDGRINLKTTTGDDVSWSCGKGIIRFREVNELNGRTIPDGTWLIPKKFNQGGYDAAQLDGDTLRFVQITRSSKHSLNCNFLGFLEDAILNTVSSIEVAVVLPFGVDFKGFTSTTMKCFGKKKRKLEETDITMVFYQRIIEY